MTKPSTERCLALLFIGEELNENRGDLEEYRMKFSRAIAFTANILASLGLYSLVSLNAIGRIRAFSVRKVLEADIPSIYKSLIIPYIPLTIGAILLSVPLSYLMISANLDMMCPHSMLSDFSGVITFIFILLLVMGTVIITQIRRITRSDAEEGLNVE